MSSSVELYFVHDKRYDANRKGNTYVAITNDQSEAERLVSEKVLGATGFVSRRVRVK